MPIVINEDYDMFLIHTNMSTYAFGIAQKDMLLHFYWGPKVQSVDEIPFLNVFSGASFTGPKGVMPLEFNTAWGMSYVENCLKVQYADGVRSLHFEYVEAEIVEEEEKPQKLVVHLKDQKYKLDIYLNYLVFEETDIIGRYIEIQSRENQSVLVDHIFSALWNFPTYRTFDRLTHIYGYHAHEFQVVRTPLTPGKKVLESRRGSTGHYQNPFFMLDDGTATEEDGQVYFGGLEWSGSWKVVAERTSHGFTRILGGINNYDFQYALEENQTFTTPVFYAGFTGGGFGQASRKLHEFQAKHVLPQHTTKKVRKIIYNSWEVTTFGVNEKQQMELAEVAADLGVEIFVMDDGWFGKRNHDRAGLGDWTPNPEKFPNGLQPLIEKVINLGMEFGLWFEPEMINPDSNLYREHPEWVIQFPGRDPDQGRNQLNLNLALKDVRNYVFNAVSDILSEYPGISYIKWDMNKSLCDVPEKWMWFDYVQNLYWVFAKLKEDFPHVHIENCSGGGGRVDMGLMRYYETNWTSDNTNPFQRLYIQEGFTHAYTPRIMSAWITDSGNFDLKYRFHSSMMGIMGIGANILKWTEEEKKVARKMVEKYKKIRYVVQFGDLYRIRSPRDGKTTVVEYISKDKEEAYVFVFKNHSDLDGDIIKVPVGGLDPQMQYSAHGFTGLATGKALMDQGLTISLTGAHQSVLLEIKKT